MHYWKNILALATLAAVLLVSGCSNQDKHEETFLWGQADATEVDVNTKVPGRLVELYVKEGSLVHKGDVLAKIDAREQNALKAAAKAKVEEARAASLKARANLEQSERDVARYASLYQSGAVSREIYENYSSQRDVYAATYKQSEAALIAAAEAYKQSDIHLGETNIIAPFDGIVTTKYSDLGAMISTGMPIVAVQNPQDNWINFKVKETDLDKYKLNDRVKLIGRNGDLQLDGTIVDISHKPNFATYRATSERADAQDIITFNVKVQTDSLQVKPGMRFRIAQG